MKHILVIVFSVGLFFGGLLLAGEDAKKPVAEAAATATSSSPSQPPIIPLSDSDKVRLLRAMNAKITAESTLYRTAEWVALQSANQALMSIAAAIRSASGCPECTIDTNTLTLKRPDVPAK